jgi:putative SOS response-associated peptidase YedK
MCHLPGQRASKAILRQASCALFSGLRLRGGIRSIASRLYRPSSLRAVEAQSEIMCGRYYRQSDKQEISETFHVTRWAPDSHLAPDYNIAPSTLKPIIRSSPEDGEREVVLMRWGLIPGKTVTRINSRPSRQPDRWLSDYDEFRPPPDLFRPFDSEGMRMTRANRLVGNVCKNGTRG